MKIHQRTDTLYIVGLILVLFIFIPRGLARACSYDQDNVTHDDGYQDSDKDHNEKGSSYHSSDRIIGHNLISENNGSVSTNGNDMFVFSLSNVLSLSKSCSIIKLTMSWVFLHSQGFVQSLFHPPKAFLA
ncbi:MAG: hypothetical protein M1381_08810 [Deltaproteobacteria bacterium]|nr:hypothetical protein [Deltaproteobacteria bacterium]